MITIDYSKQIFEILGVKPYERFKVIDKHKLMCEGKAYIRYDLKVYKEYNDGSIIKLTSEMLTQILIGDYNIIKISNYTKKEIEAAKVCITLGMPYMARDKENRKNFELKVYKGKPTMHDDKYYSDFNSETEYFYLYLDPNLFPNITFETGVVDLRELVKEHENDY